MGKYNAYEKYKDSEVEWLGEIPEHWDSISISRFTSKITNGYVGPTRDILVESGIRYIQSLHIKDGKILFDRGHYFVTKEWSEQHQKSQLKIGDILIVQTGDIGQTALVREEYENCNCHALIIMTPIKEKINGAFLELFLRSKIGQYFLKSYQTGALHPHLNGTQIKDIKITLPPLPEQQAIANFLDYKTKQIDALINKKETLLEKLDEKRTAIISHAVTKGLDPNVPMRDSGIEWLGEIPEHWDIVRLKYMSSGITVGIVITPAKYYVESGVPCLRSLNIKENRIDENNLVFISEESNELLKKSKIFIDDLVAVRTGQPGTTAVVTDIFNGANCIDLIIIKKSKKFISNFLCYQLNSPYCKYQFTSGTDGAIQQHFNIETACNLLVLIPQLKEQQEIAEFLKQKITEIDQQKAKIKQAIDRLKEYRTALITNAVTGKIDVRQVPIP